MKGAPRSAQFDDIYFSAENGLAETEYVFLRGNNLPEAWKGKKHFTIGETGFGTGLNFLTAWNLFEKTAQSGQMLDFISFEKYPLNTDEIREALTPWQDQFNNKIDLMLRDYPMRIAGFHRMKITSQITLTLIFDDINDAFPTLDACVDCWFLDGFTPAKNPDMWSNTVFENMARVSASNASYATFTAAGSVRRGLAISGFSVEKQIGFGHKRDMIAGHYQGEGKTQTAPHKQGSRIAIIGGGLAGTACAYTLKEYGFDPVIYEASGSLARGASGNKVGFYNPRFTAQRDAISNFFVPAFNQFYQTVKHGGDDISFKACGALHLINAPEKQKRFDKLMQNWRWHDDHITLLSSKKASDIAGIDLNMDALYLPQSGSVSPHSLCHYYAQNIDVHLNNKIDRLNQIEADVIILCNGFAVSSLIETPWLDLETVRGQVTEVESTALSENLKCNIHHGGYLSAPYDGKHMIGATFQRWLDHDDLIDGDHTQNIEQLKGAISALSHETFNVIDGKAGLRTATKDRFPLVGSIPNMNNIYASLAFGSHGLVGSIMAAHHLADLLRQGCSSCLPTDTQYALNAQRFIDRTQ